MTDTNAGGARPASDVDALIERLQGFNPPDRTIASQRDYSQAIHDAADALVQLREERDALKQDAERTHERICQAIDCRNMGDHAKGWDILRQWLVDVADAAREKV